MLKGIIRWLAYQMGLPDAVRRRKEARREGDCVYILFGHRVTAPGDSRGVPSDSLDALLGYLRSQFDALTVADAVERLQAGGGSSRPGVALTFDDGYADNLHHLLPVLRARRFPATVFVTSGTIGTRERLWFEETRRCIRETNAPAVEAEFLEQALPLSTPQQRTIAAEAVVEGMKATLARPAEAVAHLREALGVAERPCDDTERMLSREELAALAADPLVTIGAHTVRHPMLARLPAEDAAREIEDSRAALAEIIGYQPAFFAYPNGQPEDIPPAAVEHLRRSGWKCAVTTVPAVARRDDDPMLLPRLPLGSGPPERLAWSLARAAQRA